MIQEKIEKEKTNQLIDTLIKSGGGRNQYGKLNDVVKVFTSNSGLLRSTLLIWLDAMGVMEVNENYEYHLHKPSWIKSSIKNHFILYGAVTSDEIESLEKNDKILKYDKNSITYKNFEIELPDTYFTFNSEVFKEFSYNVIHTPIFLEIDSLEGWSTNEDKLYKGSLEKIDFNDGEVPNEVDGYKIFLDEDSSSLFIYPEDDIKQFNWRTRNYIKCDLIKELNIEKEEAGLKLIKITKTLDEKYKVHYTILLEKIEDEDWKYTYFNPKIIDERCARYSYIDKLQYYDIEKDFRRRENSVKGAVGQNAMSAMNHNCEFITEPPTSNNFMKIPDVIRKQMVQYDSRKGLMAFPVSMPLPKEIMRCLFSCSGAIPEVYTNKFTINPDFNMKQLFSGVLSPEGENVPYPIQKYFMKEEFYLFSSVPTELAEKIFEKLNLDMKQDVFKRTFLEKK